MTEEKEVREQAECLFKVTKERAYLLCIYLDWYTDVVFRQVEEEGKIQNDARSENH